MSGYPQMFRVRQTFERPRVLDIPAEVKSQLARLSLRDRIQPGETVAISAGSRGIANIATIIKAIVDHLQGIGAKPFIVPAMGSHGGGTAEGQRGILAGYGITESAMGCPIQASMETVIVCQTAEGIPVHFDKHAYGANHVVVCGRIKPHTGFVGDIESGLMKMMLIGLGKHEGAKIYHRAINDYSFGQIVRSVADRVLAECRVVAGVGIVENGYDETALIEAVAPAQFESREKELLVLAKRWMPRLPFRTADVLIIEEIGKNISGAGMDTNVVGRKFHDHKALDDEWPKVKRIMVRGLTEETHGNAAGIGIAEFCTTRCYEQIDFNITRINCLTGGHPSGAQVPVYYDTDREVLDAALSTCGLREGNASRILWIRNTLHLSEVECAECYLDEARQRDDLEIIVEPREMPFGPDGNLEPFDPELVGGPAH
ncbi:MAG: DUF2088 domain-containing protein [Pirellulales bacterium]|nr:DUF2088 domain-containing protein [Pirellulales bacterium]